MNKLYIKIIILFFSYFGFSTNLYAAEVLQVSSSSILLIGDHNRTYTVQIACVETSPDLEARSISWLKKELPRHTKVNLKPKGSRNGVLVARVIPFNSDFDIAEKYVSQGLAKNKC